MAEFRNLSKAIRDIGVMDAKMDKAVLLAATLMAAEVERTAKGVFKGSHKAGTPTPSQVGQPPTPITGTLRRSITSKVARKGFGKYEAEIGPTVVYGRALELGHPRWAAGINYPFMAHAAKILKGNDRLQLIYKKALERAL